MQVSKEVADDKTPTQERLIQMQVSNDVLAVLSTLSIDGPFVKIGEQLDRKLYMQVNKVLEACGGKWERRHQAHLFDGDARERIEQVITLGEVTTAQDLGFFRTPEKLARQLVELADVQPGHFVLEPSAGDGAIVAEIIKHDVGCFAIERDARRREQLIKRFSGPINLQTAFATIVPPTIGAEDFMEYDPIEPFDRVVMNPPFLKVGLGDHLDHVRHAYSMLCHGGVLVSVLPAGVQFRNDRRHRDFREWAKAWGSIEDLPEDSFRASGTGVRTCVFRIKREE